MDLLEQRVQKIEQRNNSVEMDKAWETSWTRTGLVAAFTYITMGVFLSFIDVTRPWLSATVPTLGFVLSTLSMPYFKRAWGRKRTILR
ncbi:MAG: hypothetical protein AAB804_00260 [Patescibacteria group bacterium]